MLKSAVVCINGKDPSHKEVESPVVSAREFEPGSSFGGVKCKTKIEA